MCFSAMAPEPAGVNEPAHARGAMSRTGLRGRGVAARVASADLSEEDPERVKEGLACVSRPSFDESQAVVGGTGTCPGIAPLEYLCSTSAVVVL